MTGWWRRKRRACGASSFVNIGSAKVTDYCTRERGHDGPHANGFTQTAWVVTTVAQPVSYRWPYENLRVDSTLLIEGVNEFPEYHGKSTLIKVDVPGPEKP